MPDNLKKLENSLLSLKVFGGIVKTDIPLDLPEDETKIDELELIFSREHEGIENPDYEKEAAELMRRYEVELNKQKIAELNKKLSTLDEESDEYLETLKDIADLQKT